MGHHTVDKGPGEGLVHHVLAKPVEGPGAQGETSTFKRDFEMRYGVSPDTGKPSGGQPPSDASGTSPGSEKFKFPTNEELDAYDEKIKKDFQAKNFPKAEKSPDEEMFEAMAGYKSPHGELKPETWHPKWEDLPNDIKKQYPNPDILTEKDWADIGDLLDTGAQQAHEKDLSFPPEEVQKMQELQDFLKPPPEEEPPFEPNVPRFRKGTKGVRKNPKAVGHPRKIGVEKGFGPRHAANVKEGEDLTSINTDTVPAMLTPREAVLNRNAAELAAGEHRRTQRGGKHAGQKRNRSGGTQAGAPSGRRRRPAVDSTGPRFPVPLRIPTFTSISIRPAGSRSTRTRFTPASTVSPWNWRTGLAGIPASPRPASGAVCRHRRAWGLSPAS